MARGTFGERLKRERELREVTLEEITSATRISSRFLEALENEDWDKLPGGVFNRGFVRSIARYLGLDEEALLGEYDLAHGAQAPPLTERPEQRIPSPPKWIPVAMVLMVIALLAGVIVGGRYAWRYYQARRARTYSMSANAQVVPQPTVPAQSATPFSTETPPIAPPSSSVPLELSVSASAPCHLRVLADSNLVFDNDLHAGETRRFTALRELEVSASESGAVLLDLNGQTVPSIGMPGSSGTIKLSAKDLRQPDSGNAKP
jgi:cytoskeletal protein RodZ